MSTPARPAPDKTLAIVGLLGLFALGWSVAEWLPMQLRSEFSLFQVVWVRYATHLLCMLVVLLPRYGRLLWQTRRPGLQLGRGLLMLIMPASYIFSLGRVRGGDVLAFFWLTPLCILAFAALVQRDRAPWPLWGAAFAASLGALMILRPTSAVADAAFFGLGMALSFSLYVVLTRSLRNEPTLANLFYSALAVFVPLTFALPAFWQPLTIRDALIMAGVGLTGIVVLWTLDKACEIASVNVFAPLFAWQLLLYVPVLALAGGLGKLALVGVVLIGGATVVVLRYSATFLSAPEASQETRLKVEIP